MMLRTSKVQQGGLLIWCSYVEDSVFDVDFFVWYEIESVNILSDFLIDTARHMHFNYNATNQQLRRMLRMDLSILEELFP